MYIEHVSIIYYKKSKINSIFAIILEIQKHMSKNVYFMRFLEAKKNKKILKIIFYELHFEKTKKMLDFLGKLY